MEPAPAGGTVGGNKLPFWAIKSAEKWEFVGPPYYAPQVRSSLQRKLFFTICRRQILHHAQRAFFTTAQAVLPYQFRERSEPNSEPLWGAIK